jgi:ribosomal protein L11 methyltransferase
MANIQADVLEMLAPSFPARLVSGGALVLSGLLAEQADGVRAVYETKGLRFVGRSDEGEWSALRFSAG